MLLLKLEINYIQRYFEDGTGTGQAFSVSYYYVMKVTSDGFVFWEIGSLLQLC